MARAFLVLLLAPLSLSLAGCQSTRSWQTCPGIYSGMRYYADQLPELPADGKAFFTLDVPFSAIADTLALPVTAFAKPPTRPIGGWPIGCRWASPVQLRGAH